MYRRQAFAVSSPGHSDGFGTLNNFAIAVFTRFQKLGKMEDLKEAAAYFRQALALCTLTIRITPHLSVISPAVFRLALSR
jgi:hypothetical protein